MDSINISDNHTQSVNHTLMYETLCNVLMTPEMIKIRKKNMEKRIMFNSINKSILIQKIKEDNMDFIDYLKELNKENIKYCIKKII